MKPLCDLHTHTVASGHAYSTLLENVHMAAMRGLKVYGHSDHARLMPGTTDEIYFTNFKVIPREIEGVRILHGIEANILDELGTIDVSQNCIINLITSLRVYIHQRLKVWARK